MDFEYAYGGQVIVHCKHVILSKILI